MGEKVIGGIEPLTATGFDGATEMQRVPVDDDGGEQVAGGGIEPVRDPAFGRDQRIRAQPLDRRDHRQDGHGVAAAGNETPGEVTARRRVMDEERAASRVTRKRAEQPPAPEA